jgi:hypothetical protein
MRPKCLGSVLTKSHVFKEERHLGRLGHIILDCDSISCTAYAARTLLLHIAIYKRTDIPKRPSA